MKIRDSVKTLSHYHDSKVYQFFKMPLLNFTYKMELTGGSSFYFEINIFLPLILQVRFNFFGLKN